MVNRVGAWKNDAHVEMLKALHREGKSASQMAKALNRAFKDADYTRNACIGKLSRLGLTMSLESRRATNVFKNRQNMRGAQSAEFRAPKVARDRHNGGMHMKANKLRAAASAAASKAATFAVAGNGAVFERAPGSPEPIIDRKEPAGLATSLTLGPRMCKWPIGDPRDPGFTFCGKKTSGIYCEGHSARAYTAPNPKARKTANELARSLRRWIAA